ncbi:branched-chain amino acid ABC transporter substrate-binding protein [Haloarcula hispanica N601]|uniref:Branched-chain amino acid ABC transporter substrate-binding protein n=2 Tax=Haloarcula hispanica TaxID=51589 RepID=V5TML7_HALHI|nr:MULTISPECIES: amino acid ABC transporter substrate-binding protein [Haloarcula]AEM57581.1 branched-chain amino acid ABC transporter amino acid-binding protein [Haloarcula hispanica ATCC 33960]AHB66343.1 branched-chain amino acid ABC transporter substrate-binding protein [Haloarcula hispanica N601]KZX49451.1 branched-chain amino acid ABC transporter substrate-binding protein [Haloarcula sp. K1]MUV50529.1 ABC transporter substrate-binding protein [Haloarcula sp. CBA1122]
MTGKQDRRAFLKVAGSTGVLGLTGLAGCSGDGGDGSSDGGDGGGGGDGSDGGSTGDSDGGMNVIKLGGSMSLTGDNADLGQLYKDAYELTIQRINESGGVEAGDGNTYELEMILRDDGTDASQSKSIYQELIDREGIDYLLGPYSSTVTLPASAVAAQNQKPMVEGGGASPEIFAQGNEWIFGLLPTANKYAKSYIDMCLAQDSTPESIAILAEDGTFSQSTAEGARNKISNTDLELVVDQTFPSDTSDLSTNLGKVRDSEADILLLCAHQKHNIILANQMESQDVNVDAAMGTVGSLNESFKDEAGANGDYMYGPSSWAVNADFDDPVYGKTGDFVSAIEENYDYTPDYHSAAGEAVILTYMNAFQNVDELNPTAVRDHIRQAEFSTVYGTVAFDDSGVIDKNMLVYQWQPESDLQIVYPDNVAQSDPVYPMPDWSER